ncbi:amino acid adenylation domain protein (plasmid) [Gloeothece citriformis PCC 7424]|uniref:Amino acid adenylation domain protein n=1 Tax=Gloeothece citriformis (strain PCC 7424) TaxID=65393 RepID=B7KLZ6_GLOC7|nr:non-ribosomal peptide synthetase [Gloeothece citriformis]ACK73818.1 amino acid adenylation domain protein [Gloeothece citriformis PCC 7424]
MQDISLSGFRLSPQQQHLCLLQQEISNQPYRIQGMILLEGNLKREILDMAIQTVIEQHEILRTVFRALPGMSIPLQVITEESNPVINYQDISHLTSEEKTNTITFLFNRLNQQLFNLEQSPIVHFSLLKISLQKHLLLIGLPALCADSKTLKNLMGEISRFYEACYNNKDIFAQPLQYVDIAEWQNELFEGEEAQLGKEYWQNLNFKQTINLKLNQENLLENKSEFTPKYLTLNFGDNLLTKINEFAQKTNSSVENILQSCWQILLYRLTGNSEITIGTFSEGRNYEELESALGLLAKYLPIKSKFLDSLAFEEVLNKIQEEKNHVFQWQDSFNWQEEDPLKIPFFPFCFEFDDEFPQYCAVGLTFSLEKQYSCIDRFKIKLVGIHRHNKLIAQWHYDSSRFSSETIAQLGERFTTLLEDALNTPQKTIENLEILGKEERRRLLIEFNQTEQDFLPEKCIHQLFEQQTALTPENIAVIYENEQLTYKELDAKANQLAHYLKELGVNSDTIVALCVERSLLLVVGLLGILKAGGAYLPLDPQLPSDRLTFMLEDAQGDILLTQKSLSERFLGQAKQVICLDDWKPITHYPQESSHSTVTPDNLAYIIYTSGSTGKPKGVTVEHRQLFNYLQGILQRLQLSQPANFATVSTFAADLGNTAIFPALCSGGSLHIISQERAMNPDALAQYCEDHPIDCLKIVPSHLNGLLMAANPEKILPKKYLILGGEVLNWQLVKQIQSLSQNLKIVNHYGPTETTVGVLTYQIEQESHQNVQTVPLGRPLPNTQIYLLDEKMRPVPFGDPGEIYIGGKNVTRGYLNREDLTGDRFINNPFDPSQQSKLYKTGDLGRYLPDGNLEFLSRVDHQVKLHGFRIELGEIETLLKHNSAIRDVVVVMREEDSGKKQLVAYIVLSQGSEISYPELRNHLKEKLPDYMIPAVFVPLKALPLTPNGKIDRQSLPTPDSNQLEKAKTYQAPRTAIETTLAEIWSQVLGLERVGIEDNFFELGGDSILSLQITARANQAGLKISPKQLFEYPTIAGLASVAGTATSKEAEQAIVTGSLPLTPIQHWFFEQELPDPHYWNQAVLLEAKQPIDPDLLSKAIQHLTKHHDALRMQFIQTQTGWESINGDWDENQQSPFSCIDLSSLAEIEQDKAFNTFANEQQASLNLSKGQLMGVTLFNFGKNRPVRLLWIIHHLVVDGVSWRVLIEDLQTAYEQLVEGKPLKLPAKTTSFKQWSQSLQNHSKSEKLQQEQDYWLKIPHQSLSPLPVDYRGGSNTLAEAETISVTLNKAETQSLLQEAPAIYRTQINDLLLTALVQTFSQWTGEPKLLLNLEGHGRESIIKDLDLSRTVGWFTTIFPVLLSLEGICEPGEAIKSIKEQLRSIPTHGIGYGVLRYLSSNQSLKTLPQAEVRLNYLGQLDIKEGETALFKLVNQNLGYSRSPRGKRAYLLDINGFVLEGQLRLNWTYSHQIHASKTIERLADGFIDALRSIITHCQSPNAGGYTPRDFPQAKLNQKDLNKLLSKFNLGNK